MKRMRLMFLVIGLTPVLASGSGTSGLSKNSPSLGSGFANVVLLQAGTTLTATTNTAWTLAKTGTVNTANSTVTWTITATPGATTSGSLTAQGFLLVANLGTAGATIGNIVVNLQTRSGALAPWVTRSSDIADATHGDAATSALVVPGGNTEHQSKFTENAASGTLSFTDAKNNTAFSLSPEITIPRLSVVPLLFAATFDNNVLKLAKGTDTRIEVIVTFGNHALGGPNLTDQKIDINGNGVIDPDEKKVRSVSALTERLVPAPQAANTSVTIADTVANIAATGTATFSNPVFNLGAMSGTVTVSYDGGTSGGSITNCATASGSGITTKVGSFTFQNVPPVQLQACNTQTVAAQPTCVAGTVGCGWHDGDMIAYGPTDWASEPTGMSPGELLVSHYNGVYASTSGVFTLGDPAGFQVFFTDGLDLNAFFPSSGPPGVFDGILINPSATPAGDFAGAVGAVKLDVDFSDAGLLTGKAGLKFGDLRLCGFSDLTQFYEATEHIDPTKIITGFVNKDLTPLNNMDLRTYLAMVNVVLSGTGPVYSPLDLDDITLSISQSFDGGQVTTFAQQYFVNGTCH